MELLVVIAVIAVLIALLLPALSRAKAKAQNMRCVGNLHQLGIGLQTFLANNHGYISWYAKAGEDYPGTWINQMELYGLGIYKPATNFFNVGVWRCPSAQFGAWLKGLSTDAEAAYYAYNSFGLGNNRTNSLGLSGHFLSDSDVYVPVRESEVIVPSDMMAIGDSFAGDVGLMRENLDYLKGEGNTVARHQGRANVVFCDGHVESPTLQSLFVDTGDEALSRWNRDHLPHREKLSP